MQQYDINEILKYPVWTWNILYMITSNPSNNDTCNANDSIICLSMDSVYCEFDKFNSLQGTNQMHDKYGVILINIKF